MPTYYVTGVEVASGGTVTFPIHAESEAQAHIAASKPGIKILHVYEIDDDYMEREESGDSPIDELAKASQAPRREN